jgi:Trk K+ transport system NAD-binding subunit
MLFALLQACSAIKIAYNQAPVLAYLYLDGYVDFNETQAVQIKADLGKFQAWHRQTQLPAYIDLLQKTQPKIQQDMGEKQACEIFNDVRQKALNLTDYAEPATLAMAATFTTRQLTAIERKFAKSNTTWREEFLEGSAKDLAEKRQKSAVKRAEMLYGALNDKQLNLIAAQIERSKFNAAQSYAERQRRQKDMLQTLSRVVANPQDQEAVRRDMRGLLARSTVSPDTTYRKYQEQAIEEACSSFAELHNTTTAEQRKKAVGVLAGYEQDFRVLVSQK